MLGSLFERLFKCRHHRLTRPITPVTPDVSNGRTYVVCLDCAKHFEYDWGQMKVGKVIPQPVEGGVLPDDRPRRLRRGVKYAIVGSVLPLAVLLGKVLVSRPRRSRPSEEEKPKT